MYPINCATFIIQCQLIRIMLFTLQFFLFYVTFQSCLFILLCQFSILSQLIITAVMCECDSVISKQQKVVLNCTV